MAHPDLEGCPKQKWPEDGKSFENPTGPKVQLAALAVGVSIIGIVTTEHLSFEYWGLAVLVFVASLVVRFLVIYSTTQMFTKWREEMGCKKAFLLTWSGIRGTMSVVLVLTLPERASGEMELLLSLSFAVIVLSLIVQSLGIYPLLSRLSDEEK